MKSSKIFMKETNILKRVEYNADTQPFSNYHGPRTDPRCSPFSTGADAKLTVQTNECHRPTYWA